VAHVRDAAAIAPPVQRALELLRDAVAVTVQRRSRR
jgi:hypothetical protein